MFRINVNVTLFDLKDQLNRRLNNHDTRKVVSIESCCSSINLDECVWFTNIQLLKVDDDVRIIFSISILGTDLIRRCLNQLCSNLISPKYLMKTCMIKCNEINNVAFIILFVYNQYFLIYIDKLLLIYYIIEFDLI